MDRLRLILLVCVVVALSTSGVEARKRWYRCKLRGDPHVRSFNKLRYDHHGVPASYPGYGPLPTGKENQLFSGAAVNGTEYYGGVYRLVNASSFSVDCMTQRTRRNTRFHKSHTQDCSLTFYYQQHEYVLTVFQKIENGFAGRFEVQQLQEQSMGRGATEIVSTIISSTDLTVDDFVSRRQLNAVSSDTVVFHLYGKKRTGKKNRKRPKLGAHFWAGREEEIGNRRYSNRFLRRGTTVVVQVHYQTKRFFNNAEDLEEYQHVPTTGWCGYPVRDDKSCDQDLSFFLPTTHPQATNVAAASLMTCNATHPNAPPHYMLCQPLGDQSCKKKRKRRDVFVHEAAFDVCHPDHFDGDKQGASCFYSAHGSHLRAIAQAFHDGIEFSALSSDQQVDLGDMTEERRAELCGAYFTEQEASEAPADALSSTDRNQVMENCISDLQSCNEADMASNTSFCRLVAFSNIDAELDVDFGEATDEEEDGEDSVLLSVGGIAVSATTALVVSAAVAFTVGFALFIHVRRRQANSFFRELDQQGIAAEESHQHFGVM